MYLDGDTEGLVLHEDQLALRTWVSQIERAEQIAKTMGELPRCQLLGITKTTVLRLALVDGIEVAEQAAPKYFKAPEAQRLLDAIEGGITTSTGFRLPIINSFNVMLTPEPYSDTLLARGVLDLHSGRLADSGKEVLINVRVPRALAR